jgi:hypothetical protein
VGKQDGFPEEIEENEGSYPQKNPFIHTKSVLIHRKSILANNKLTKKPFKKKGFYLVIGEK